MNDELYLNVSLLRRRVPNLTSVAPKVGLRPATVSNLCTGKISVGRAEVRTIVALAKLADCSLDELIIRGGYVSMIETGIKVIDLLSPIVRGGTTGLVARPGVGQLVLLSELFNRLNRRGYKTLFWKPSENFAGSNGVEKESEFVGSNLEDIFAKICDLGSEYDVLLAADRKMVLSGEFIALRERLVKTGVRPITILLVDILGEAVYEDVPYGPLDTLISFDTDLATRNMYPSINPITSTSTMMEGGHLEATHHNLQQSARRLLRRYRELRPLVITKGFEFLTEDDKIAYIRGERLEAFLTQPFYVAEEFTKKPGIWLSLHDTLDGVKQIIDGARDGLESEKLTYIGHLV